MSANFQQLANFIWSVADLLRGPYRPPQYERVMLPLTVLRRFDAVLASSKEAVLKRHAELSSKGIPNIDAILNNLAKDEDGTPLGFHNHSQLDFYKLKGDPDNIGRHLADYINGFSENPQDLRALRVRQGDREARRVASKFGHMFYESTSRDGRKEFFSPVRAQRIDWIKSTLGHPNADLFEGWDKGSRAYDATRRVAVVYEDFVVVVAMGLKLDGALKANFVTCYQADNSIGKIRTSPTWSRVDCVRQLGGVP